MSYSIVRRRRRPNASLLAEAVRTIGKRRFEIRQQVSCPLEDRKLHYLVETWFFFPQSLQINRWSYTAKRPARRRWRSQSCTRRRVQLCARHRRPAGRIAEKLQRPDLEALRHQKPRFHEVPRPQGPARRCPHGYRPPDLRSRAMPVEPDALRHVQGARSAGDGDRTNGIGS